MYYEFYVLSGVTKVVDKITSILGDKALHVSPIKSPTSLPAIASSPNQIGLEGVSSFNSTPVFVTPPRSPRGSLSVDVAARASSHHFMATSSTKPIEHSPSQSWPQPLITGIPGEIDMVGFNKAWSVITDPTKIVKARREEILEYLDEMGMACAEDLHAHAEDADTLKTVKEFLNPTGVKYWEKIFPV